MTAFRVVFYKNFTVFFNSGFSVKIGNFQAVILPNCCWLGIRFVFFFLRKKNAAEQIARRHF